MYSRVIKEDILGDFDKDNYLYDLYKYSEVLDTNVESQKQGYMPFYTVVYVRSTSNEVIVNTDVNEPIFYKVIKSNFKDVKTFIEDEAILNAKDYFSEVASEDSLNDMGLIINTFPSSRGVIIISPEEDSENFGVYIVMSVVIEGNTFKDKLKLTKGYAKKEFERSNYSNNFLSQLVSDTFIKIHRP